MSEPAPIPVASPSRPAGGRWRAALPFIVACMMMLGMETWMFLYQSDEWDLYAYQSYAQYYNFKDSSLGDLYSDNTVEYPPLAVVLMIATEDIAQQLPVWHGLPPQTYDPDESMESFNKFKVFYRLEMAAVIFATFLLLCRMQKLYLPGESRWEWAGRLAVFFTGLALMAQLAFDRLDAVLGALLILALALMRGRRHYFWSFLVLAAAIAFKFVPVILAPLWVVGSLPVEMLASLKTAGAWRRLLVAMTGRGMLLAALIILLFLPFVISGGMQSLAFFTYHSARGIEFGSNYSAVLGILKYAAGLKTSISTGYGSHNIESSLSPVFTHLAPVVMLGLLVAATFLLLASILRAPPARAPRPGPAGVRFGRACGGEFTLHMMLLLLIFIFANKVFSPQYILWLLPLAPVMPLPRGKRRLFNAAFLALCLLTFLIYPIFVDDTLGKQLPSAPDEYLFAGSTPFGVALLAARALLMTGMIAGLALHLLRGRQPHVCFNPGQAAPATTTG